jgi:hypothetical protein
VQFRQRELTRAAAELVVGRLWLVARCGSRDR